MIVLDTNVLSEAMRAQPDAAVMAWFAARSRSELFTTTLTQAEIICGLALLPDGARKNKLLAAAHELFEFDLAGRILPFDTDAAMAYPELAAHSRGLGRPIAQVDGQMAAIVKSRGARLATRNIRDFQDCGIALIEPWQGV